ncbi:phospholipid/glycerol acyltransferase [Gloeomargarita lithophora Alchichica-D10]|uniref:Phospholipid/glycerol acyltransferase n=2 Tax=Gloeomargarita TaxID=1188227 RepID=A0A1J0AGD3_9CYAN|nr:phospholipid/glycerol acyltransferase [Gloeomargarita lithophora Alchichica-D10]
MRTQLKIAQVRVEGAATLVPWYEQVQKNQARVLLAFRHPTLDDPYMILYLLSRSVPQAARGLGVKLKLPLHNYFIYDRGIPLWAGRWVGWLFSRLGGIPIQRGRSDRTAIKTIRELLVRGGMPLTVAPEGGINSHSERLAPLEPGLPQMGFWCLEDLAKQGQEMPVVVIPIGIQYGFLHPPWEKISELLAKMETWCGLPVAQPLPTEPTARQEHLYARLLGLADYLLTQMEAFYARFYHHSQASIAPDTDLGINAHLKIRLERLREAALAITEAFFGVKGEGTTIDRCRRLESAGWEWLYRQDWAELSPMARNLADRIAQEAELRLWHMQLVERLTSVTGDYVREKPTADRFAEITLILWSVVTHLRGKNQPANLGQRWVAIRVGEPLRLNDYWDTYQSNRKAARQVVNEVTDTLAQRLQALIVG